MMEEATPVETYTKKLWQNVRNQMSEDQLSCICTQKFGLPGDIIFTHFLNGIRSDNTNKPSPGRYHNRNGNVLSPFPRTPMTAIAMIREGKAINTSQSIVMKWSAFSPAQALKVPTIRPITDKISSTGKLIPMEYLAPYSSLDKVPPAQLICSKRVFCVRI